MYICYNRTPLSLVEVAGGRLVVVIMEETSATVEAGCSAHLGKVGESWSSSGVGSGEEGGRGMGDGLHICHSSAVSRGQCWVWSRLVMDMDIPRSLVVIRVRSLRGEICGT